MANMSKISKENYSELLAAQVLDASKGALFGAAGLQPDDTNRTILIGVGGTGVRTIDYVKGAISKRLAPNWKDYVAFLGIDASWSEFKQARYLESGECILTTQDNVANRMQNESTYPAAVRPFVPEGARLGALSSDGSGRTRLVGKVKIHDQAPGADGVDQKIVQKLSMIKNTMMGWGSDVGTYQVYVIGSVCGGTCSGSFLELPALIRKAFPTRVKVNAMLYLPDTLATLDPKNASQLYANGYASLKELNYFMGMSMRPEYSETWSYNDLANPTLEYQSSAVKEEFIDIPYLIGTTNGMAQDASQEAMETIAEFLISLLAKISTGNTGMFLTSAFESNATATAKTSERYFAPGNMQLQHTGEHHEFPKRFAAIGFAEASAPQKLVRAYTVGRICENAGIKSVDADKRAALVAGGAHNLIPFRGEDDLLNATEGTAKAVAIMQPVAQILNVVHSGTFNFGQDLQEPDITWTKIKNHHYDNPAIAAKTNNFIETRASTQMIEALRKAISTAFAQYRKNVQAYVREEGPYAFYNLYTGKFSPVNDDFGIGIGRMIQNLVDGNLPNGKPFNGWKTVTQAMSELNAVRNLIDSTSPGVFGIEGGKHKDQASQWVSAYNNWCRARINEKRREVALGAAGALRESFLLPAAKLAEEIYAFGGVLESLSDIYQSHGEKMESFEAFKDAQDTRTEVNMAAVNPASYNWLKEQANAFLVKANAHKLRDDLIDHFFSADQNGIPNTDKWLDVPQSRITNTPTGKITLAIPDVAVPAREIFDKYLADNFPISLNVSIEEMFVQLQNAGQSFNQSAHSILEQLATRSMPHVNGDIPQSSFFRYVVYPEALNTNPPIGPQIAAAIQSEAQSMFPGIGVHSSADTDCIMFYQMAAPFEIYRLHELANWESHYENGAFGINNNASFLHGKSPDIVTIHQAGRSDRYVETMPWQDYPSIVRHSTDPTMPDPRTGRICREGQLRLKLADMIKEARSLGVLYSEQNANGQWIVKRVHCNKTIQWNFDVMKCVPDSSGLLPLGKALAEAVASQNNRTLSDISREVMLSQGGVFDKWVDTEEMAWEYAACVLRAHVPMYIEVRESVARFNEWAVEIRKANEEVQKGLLPAMMVYMLKGRILMPNADGLWVLQQGGSSKVVVNLSPAMAKFLPPKDKKYIDNKLFGYYLFKKLEATLSAPGAFEAAFKAAKDNLETMMNNADISALTAGEEWAEKILAEIADLQAKGAYLDGDSSRTPRTAFAQEMKLIGIADEAEVKAIDDFYYKMGLWTNI